MKGEPLPVDRLHNLRNLLDMYEYGEPEILINESIANAIDAFRDHSTIKGKIDISFVKKNNDEGYLLFHNNAPPMTERQFYDKNGYHKVSFSSKQKGQGIGFAGVGAKLFLASEQGGEIITITGKSEKEFMASKMYRINNDVEFKTTQKYPLKEILDIPHYSHTYGTTYSVRLTSHAYRDLKEKLPGIIQFWWNYVLVRKQIKIIVDDKPLLPWMPKGDMFKKTFTWKTHKISALCFISKDKIPESSRHIIYTIFGKRIHSKELELAVKIKGDYPSRVFCIVDLSILADQLTSNKENFKRNIQTNDCKLKVESGFLKFLEEHDLLNKEFQQDNQIVTNELTRILDKLLDTKDFKDLNPFLSPKKRKILIRDTDGTIIADEELGDGSSNGSESESDDDSGRRSGDGTKLIEDDDAHEIASEKIKRSKGIRLILSERSTTHNEEATVQTELGAIVIDTLHPMYLRTKENTKIQTYNLMRILIEALIRHKNEEVEWDAKETMYRFRNLLHAVWGLE